MSLNILRIQGDLVLSNTNILLKVLLTRQSQIPLLIQKHLEQGATKVENEIYQSVVEELVKYLPAGWEKVDMYAEVTEEHSCVFFFTMINGEYIYSEDFSEKYDIDASDIGFELYPILLPDQQEKKWFSMSFYLKNTGEFNVEYDYDKPESIVIYRDNWIVRHMKENDKNGK